MSAPTQVTPKPTTHQFLVGLGIESNQDSWDVVGDAIGRRGTKTGRIAPEEEPAVREALARAGLLKLTEGDGPASAGTTPSVNAIVEAAADEATAHVKPDLETPAATQPPAEPEPLTLRALLREFKENGLDRIDLMHLGRAHPELKTAGNGRKVNLNVVLDDEWERTLRAELSILQAIQVRVAMDGELLAQWDPPQAAALLQQGKTYRYTGICGHEVQMSVGLYNDRRRMAEQADNPALTPLLRLCGDCLAQRVRLLEMPEFAANADSVCRVDGEPLFKTSGGFALSRTNHWENLISGVTTPSQLLSKLLPEHRYDHPKHQELRDQFEAWLTEFKLQMSIAMAKRPRGARELKDAMAERIAAKRVELGLQED